MIEILTISFQFIGKEYAYAEHVSASLGNALATAGKFRKWPAVLVPLP